MKTSLSTPTALTLAVRASTCLVHCGMSGVSDKFLRATVVTILEIWEEKLGICQWLKCRTIYENAFCCYLIRSPKSRNCECCNHEVSHFPLLDPSLLGIIRYLIYKCFKHYQCFVPFQLPRMTVCNIVLQVQTGHILLEKFITMIILYQHQVLWREPQMKSHL